LPTVEWFRGNSKNRQQLGAAGGEPKQTLFEEPGRFGDSCNRKEFDQSMIRKSGYRFSEKDHAPPKIWSAIVIQLKAIAL